MFSSKWRTDLLRLEGRFMFEESLVPAAAASGPFPQRVGVPVPRVKPTLEVPVVRVLTDDELCTIDMGSTFPTTYSSI